MRHNSLAEVLQAVSRFLPRTLISSPAWQGCMIQAEQIPALVCPYAFGWEILLHKQMHSADLAFCLSQPGCDILAGTHPLGFSSPLLSDPAIWPEIKAFCRAWGNPASGLSSRIINLWLEFKTGDRHTPPMPFIKLKEDSTWKSRLADTLEPLYGEKIPVPVKRNLEALLSRLPRGVRVFQAGIRTEKKKCRIRLCLEGISAYELPGFIKEIMPGSAYPFREYCHILNRAERIALHLDLGNRIGPHIGIELRQAEDKELCLSTQSEWDPVLDLLEEAGLCTKKNSSFLKSFRNSSWEMIYPDLIPFITCRLLYYLKLVFSPYRPPRVKAYFGFVNTGQGPPPADMPSPSLPVRTSLSPDILKASLKRGAAFLSQNQLPHGEFRTYLAHDRKLESAVYDSSPFATAFVLYCTRHLPETLFGAPRLKAFPFLVREGYPGFLWKYWTKTPGKSIAADLDDTCCLSFILRELYGLRSVEKNIPVLLSHRDEQGLFKTWIHENPVPDYPDIAVNANALLYLGEREETQAALAGVKEWVIRGEEQAHCWYYPELIACYYMLARAARHGVTGLRPLFPLMTSRILERMHDEGHWENELTTALAVCALRDMGAEEKHTEGARLWLINKQRENGSWRRLPFYTGPEAPAPPSVWFGSEELTTALCLEGLWPSPKNGDTKPREGTGTTGRGVTY